MDFFNHPLTVEESMKYSYYFILSTYLFILSSYLFILWDSVGRLLGQVNCWE